MSARQALLSFARNSRAVSGSSTPRRVAADAVGGLRVEFVEDGIPPGIVCLGCNARRPCLHESIAIFGRGYCGVVADGLPVWGTNRRDPYGHR